MSSNIKERAEIIREMLDAFRFERYVYLIINLISFIILVSSVLFLLFKSRASISHFIGLFSSSGGIAYTTGRLLRMWSDALKFIQPYSEGERNE